MKRNIIKVLSGLLIGISLLGTCQIAHADADSSHWLSYGNGDWAFFNPSFSHIYSNAWVKVEGKWYYLKSSGLMARNEWLQLNGAWYYFADNGAMAHDTWVNGYHLNSSGAWDSNVK